MVIYFSPGKSAFYPSDMLDLYLDAGSLPSDLIEATESEISEYMMSTAPLGKILGTIGGRPGWVDQPELTNEEKIVATDRKIAQLISVASEKIAPLQDAVDLGVATEAETESLTKWKTYRVAVNRVPTQPGYPTAIDWPAMPE